MPDSDQFKRKGRLVGELYLRGGELFIHVAYFLSGFFEVILSLFR